MILSKTPLRMSFVGGGTDYLTDFPHAVHLLKLEQDFPVLIIRIINKIAENNFLK